MHCCLDNPIAKREKSCYWLKFIIEQMRELLSCFVWLCMLKIFAFNVIKLKIGS